MDGAQKTRRLRAKESASSVWTLIQLQFKAGVRLQRGKTPVKTAFKLLLFLILGAALLAGFVAVYYVLAMQFVPPKINTDLSKPFLAFTLGGFMVLQTVFLIPMLLKTLDLNNDREMLLKLPVSHRQIFISKMVVAYFYEIIFAAVVLTPILIAFGLATRADAAFYPLILVLLLFVPVLPFFLATLIMFPAMKVVSFMRDRSLLTIFVYLAGLVLLIVLYMQMVQGVVYAISPYNANAGAGNPFSAALETAAPGIQRTAKFIYPPQFFVNLLAPKWSTALLNFMWILISSAAMVAAAIAVANALYRRIYKDERVTLSSRGRKRVMRPHKVVSAVLKKDILNIFRSSNYTFQFLLIVIITPLLVYFCDRTAAYSLNRSFNNAGKIDSAQDMVFGVAMLIIMILIPLASCFAASNISREGYNIYHTKLIPVPFRKQLLIKTAIVFVPVFVSVAVSCALTLMPYKLDATNTMRGLTVGQMFAALGTAALMSAGYICLGTYTDLRRPVCNQIGAQELTKSTGHINFIMVLGVLVGACFGVLAMFSGFAGHFFNVDFSGASLYAFFLCVAAVFAAVTACLLFLDGPRKYRKLEQ